tara:strand:- start:312 stop:593 length:282 start_codon:yes stop_codon:yes gene_type:complete
VSKFDITVLHEDCDPTLANDKKLPYSAYLVEYKKEDRIAYDISIAGSQVLLFDHYYDKYKKDFKTFKQSAGTINPTLWNPPKKAKAPKKPKTK